jgi:NAD(P)-dependent dehydrogenase (short-subunit alcohol dehydrogenase family)
MTPVAVVTGAARGLGRTAAIALAAKGYRVVIAARSTRETPSRVLPGTLDDVYDEIQNAGGEAVAVAADVATDAGIEAIVAASSEAGVCEVLVNNAAYIPPGAFVDVPASKWRAALMVNVWAPVALTRALLPEMIAAGRGIVINISSGAAVRPQPGMPSYTVTKAALEHLTDVVALELPEADVSIVAVQIDEQIASEANRMFSSGVGDEDHRTTPAEFGEAVAWLAARPGRFNGRVLTLADLRADHALPPVWRDGLLGRPR